MNKNKLKLEFGELLELEELKEKKIQKIPGNQINMEYKRRIFILKKTFHH